VSDFAATEVTDHRGNFRQKAGIRLIGLDFAALSSQHLYDDFGQLSGSNFLGHGFLLKRDEPTPQREIGPSGLMSAKCRVDSVSPIWDADRGRFNPPALRVVAMNLLA
jgi:hypothetical protein